MTKCYYFAIDGASYIEGDPFPLTVRRSSLFQLPDDTTLWLVAWGLQGKGDECCDLSLIGLVDEHASTRSPVLRAEVVKTYFDELTVSKEGVVGCFPDK